MDDATADDIADVEITPKRLEELILWHGTDETALPPARTLQNLSRDTIAALRQLARARETIEHLRDAMGRAFWATDRRELHAILLEALGPPPGSPPGEPAPRDGSSSRSAPQPPSPSQPPSAPRSRSASPPSAAPPPRDAPPSRDASGAREGSRHSEHTPRGAKSGWSSRRGNDPASRAGDASPLRLDARSGRGPHRLSTVRSIGPRTS